uniref:Cytochrome b5 reductase 4-like n=1 Tax=Pundamilia nyererei TaxID=303518 RepID=A0A3B4FXX0_9CICH
TMWDLSGFSGCILGQTQLNTQNVVWMFLTGMVYNVSAYMDYHPGGEEELMKAAGVDGTELFDQVHRWVNYESMLKECLVGRMSTKAATAVRGTQRFTSIYTLCRKTQPLTKYDWFQTDGTVHLVVYTRRKVIAPPVMCCKMELFTCPPLHFGKLLSSTVHTAFSVGKIQVSIRKGAHGKWASLGQPLESHNTFVRQKDRALFYRDCVLVSKTEVNHNTYLFRLQLPAGTVMHVPVGKHVCLKALVQDVEVVRPYTPVEHIFPAASKNGSQESDLYLMIKVYPGGAFTPHLSSLSVGDRVAVSGPEGTFSLRPLRDVTNLYLIAAGTGFTPMARLIRAALEDIENIGNTKLLFFNRREEDILWRFELDELAANNDRFQVEHVLSEPSERWTGRKGPVNEPILTELLSRPDGSKCYVCVCGPAAFTELTLGLLKHQGFSEQELHAFQG